MGRKRKKKQQLGAGVIPLNLVRRADLQGLSRGPGQVLNLVDGAGLIGATSGGGRKKRGKSRGRRFDNAITAALGGWSWRRTVRSFPSGPSMVFEEIVRVLDPRKVMRARFFPL